MRDLGDLEPTSQPNARSFRVIMLKGLGGSRLQTMPNLSIEGRTERASVQRFQSHLPHNRSFGLSMAGSDVASCQSEEGSSGPG